MITVFTPTYNRAYIIYKLYQSLCQQTCNDFEWLVVDDGSTDNTQELINSYISENKITIRYIHKENGGKHMAINLGVKEAKGELFFIVDSDDHLTNDAIKTILDDYSEIKHNDSCAGIGYMRMDFKGEIIKNKFPFNRIKCSAHILNKKYHVKGDMAEIFKTDILKLYPFPEIPGEKFCPEALIWFRIADKFDFLWINKGIYLCEYISDGLTAQITKHRMLSPISSMIFYSEQTKRNNIHFKTKFRSAINFWRFSYNTNLMFKQKLFYISNIFALLSVIGYIFYLKDIHNGKS